MDKDLHQRTSEKLHQRQTWLEIWLPLIIGLVLCTAIFVLVILAAVNGSGSIAQLSAISIILMIVPTFFIILAVTAVILILDYWVIRGNHLLPAYALIAQQKVEAVSKNIQQILSSVTTVFINVRPGLDSIKHFFSHSKKNKTQ